MTDDEMMFAVGVYEPGAGFDWHGSLDAMVWYGEKPKPTADELEALWPDVKAAFYYAQNAPVREQRGEAYREKADPVFFKWQRGEDGVTETDWLAAVEAVRIEFPYLESAAEE